jgi:hypothetical protein
MIHLTHTPAPLAVDERTAAKMLSLSSRTLFTLRKRGDIPAIKTGHGPKSRVIYSVAALEKFLESAGK